MRAAGGGERRACGLRPAPHRTARGLRGAAAPGAPREAEQRPRPSAGRRRQQQHHVRREESPRREGPRLRGDRGGAAQQTAPRRRAVRCGAGSGAAGTELRAQGCLGAPCVRTQACVGLRGCILIAHVSWFLSPSGTPGCAARCRHLRPCRVWVSRLFALLAGASLTPAAGTCRSAGRGLGLKLCGRTGGAGRSGAGRRAEGGPAVPGGP